MSVSATTIQATDASVVSGNSDQGAIDSNNQVQISRSGSAGYAAYLSYGRLVGSNNYGFSISALNNNLNGAILLAPKGGNVGVNTDNPTTNLDVDGNIRVRGVTGAAALATDANGTIIAGTDPNAMPGGGDGTGNFGFWNRNDTTDTLSPRTANDNLNIGSGDIDTTGDLTAADGTFSGDVTATDFVIDQTTANVTVTAADPSAARTYTFPDEGGNRNITLDAAALVNNPVCPSNHWCWRWLMGSRQLSPWNG